MAEIPDEVLEAVAQMLWHRFAPDHYVEWPCTHADEYRLAAAEALRLLSAATRQPEATAAEPVVLEASSYVIKACQVLRIYHEMMVKHLTDNPSAEHATDVGIGLHKDAVELMEYFEKVEISMDEGSGTLPVEPVVNGGWLPIESAPKDGYMLVHEDGAIRCLLRIKGAWDKTGYPAIISHPYNDVIVGNDANRLLPPGYRLELRDGCCDNPTHWMPLPTPPPKEAA